MLAQVADTLQLVSTAAAVGGAPCAGYRRMSLQLSGLTAETVALQFSTNGGVTYSTATGVCPAAGMGTGTITVVDPYNLGLGDGATTAFQVATSTGAVTVPGTIAVYRRDWQGNQLMYATARTNMILQSQTLQTTWVAVTSSVGVNAATAPDGTVTAESLIEDGSNGPHYLKQSVTTTAANHTFSIYAKASTRGAILLINLTTGDGSYFDVANGALGDPELNPVSRSITSMGNGWYRCSITVLCTAAADDFRAYLASAPTSGAFSYQGDGVSKLFLWGAQVEVGNTMTSYLVTVGATNTTTDYTINGTGLVTFAAAPLVAALLTWTGTYTGRTPTTAMGNGLFMVSPSTKSQFIPASTHFRLVKSGAAETVTATIVLT